MKKKPTKPQRLRKNLVTVEDVEALYEFDACSLHSYYLGKNSKPEEVEQKAFIAFLMAEFPEEIGWREVPGKDPVCSFLVVSLADFYDAQRKQKQEFTSSGKRGKSKGWFSIKMQNYKSMGYQRGTQDVTVLNPQNGYHGFVSEMKSRVYGAKPTDEQKITIAALQEAGYAADFDYGFPSAALRWCRYIGKEERI